MSSPIATMDFGQPEVTIAVTAVVLVMLGIMNCAIFHYYNLWNEADEEVEANETLAEETLTLFTSQLCFNMQNFFSANDEDIQAAAKMHGLPLPTQEAVIYSKKAIEVYTIGLQGSIETVFQQAREKREKRERAKRFATKCSLQIAFAAFSIIYIVGLPFFPQSFPFGPFQDITASHPTANEASFSRVFEYAAAAEQSYMLNETPSYLNSAPVTEAEGRALYQLVHGGSEDDRNDENETNTVCCQQNDLACVAYSAFSGIFGYVQTQVQKTWTHSMALAYSAAQDASTSRYSPTGSVSGSFSFFEYAAEIEQAHQQQVTPSSLSNAPMTELNGRALFGLLYGAPEEPQNHKISEPEVQLMDSDEPSEICCSESDPFCFGDFALSKIGQDIGGVFNYSSEYTIKSLKTNQVRISLALSKAYDHITDVSTSLKTLAHQSLSKLKPVPKQKPAPPASVADWVALFRPQPPKLTLTEKTGLYLGVWSPGQVMYRAALREGHRMAKEIDSAIEASEKHE